MPRFDAHYYIQYIMSVVSVLPYVSLTMDCLMIVEEYIHNYNADCSISLGILSIGIRGSKYMTTVLPFGIRILRGTTLAFL